MQMGANGLGAALIPGLVGVLADQITLEIIPICFLALFGTIFALYILAISLQTRIEVQNTETPS